MRILLDECVPRRLKKHFRVYGLVLTVTDAGLSSYTNGQLLRRISGDFDLFITVDKSIQYQQNLAAYDLAFVLLRVRSQTSNPCFQDCLPVGLKFNRVHC